MEATIQSTNRAINIDINVSINVDALKAIIQCGWQATWKAINVYGLQPIKQEVSEITLSDVVIFLMLLAFAFEIYMLG